MIIINQNSITAVRGLIPFNRLSENTINSVNQLRNFLTQNFKVDLVPQIYISEENISFTRRADAYVILKTDLSEEISNLIKTITDEVDGYEDKKMSSRLTDN